MYSYSIFQFISLLEADTDMLNVDLIHLFENTFDRKRSYANLTLTLTLT